MAKTSFSFCPLLFCSSSSRHIKFQYRRKKRNSCIFGLANFFPPPATSRGSSIGGCSHSSPSVPHSSPAQLSTRQNKLHDSRRTLHCKPPTTLTLHYMQHYTPNCTQLFRNAPRGSISGQDRKIDLYFFISFLKSLKAPKCCPCQQFDSVACSLASSVACSV